MIKTIPFSADQLSSFTKVLMTDTELALASALPALAVAMLQNMRAQIAEEKLHLTLDVKDISGFAQQEAYLRGQLDIVSTLINASYDAQNMVVIDDSPQP